MSRVQLQSSACFNAPGGKIVARKLWLVLWLSLYLLSPAAALADGDIYVGGPYGTKITSLPYTINTPGAYYLGGDLTYAGDSDGITVNADNVTLDLIGFTLTYTGASTFRYGIWMWGRKNVEIRNGTVRGWSAGIIEYSYDLPVGHRLINIRAEENDTGVRLRGDGHLIQGCTAISSRLFASGFVIDVGTGIITGCVVKNCGGHGIFGGPGGGTVISGNVVVGNAGPASVGIVSLGGLVMGNEVSNCGDKGIWVQGPASIIGNTVNTASSSQTGVVIDYPSAPTLLDQNTVTGPGTHYTGTSSAQWRNNGG
jgi:hypothetical protein